MRKFARSSYWGVWSSVHTTTAKLPRVKVVSVCLQPVNGWSRAVYDARRIMEGNIIASMFYSPDPKDEVAASLPDWLEAECRSWFGDELFKFLCFGEILGKIDWSQYDKYNNGGAPLRQIVFPRYLEQIPTPKPTPENELKLVKFEVEHFSSIKQTGRCAGYDVAWDDEYEKKLQNALDRVLALEPQTV